MEGAHSGLVRPLSRGAVACRGFLSLQAATRITPRVGGRLIHLAAPDDVALLEDLPESCQLGRVLGVLCSPETGAARPQQGLTVILRFGVQHEAGMATKLAEVHQRLKNVLLGACGQLLRWRGRQAEADC